MARKKKESKSKTSASKIICWVFGIIFILMAIGFFFSNVVSGILALVMAFLILPPLDDTVRNKLKLKMWLRIVIIVILFFVSVSMLPPSENDTTTNENIQTGDTEPIVEPEVVEEPEVIEEPQEPEIEYITESELKDLVFQFTDSRSSLTDLQKEDLWDTYRGKPVRATIYVHNVDKGMFSNYVVSGGFTPENEYTFISEIYVTFKSSEKDKLSSYSVNSRLTFTGELGEYHEIMQYLDVKNAVVV
ncbi:MAG: hypothetical protein KKH88_04490 [Nanoarchaeota archaeon]|nr:hypothetical protein [Nanoarchaeota archaeon]